MVLEATMIIMDNSAYARNGDFMPNRWEAQQDSVNNLANSKLQGNPENTVGLMTMGGKRVETLLTPIQEMSKVLACFHKIQLGGTIQFSSALQIAQLALKQRLNKNLKQRIVVFVASPITEDENTLVSLAKKLKKNSVAVDVVNIGEQSDEQINKLNKFVETVKNQDNSNFINVAPNVQILADYLLQTPIFGGAGAANIGDDFGMYDTSDPEIAEVLRISLEEERERRRRQEEEQKRQEGGEPQQKPAEAAENKPTPQLEQAAQQQQQQPQQPQPAQPIEEEDLENLDEEELLRRAQQISLQETQQGQIQEEETQKQGKQPTQQANEQFQDAEFMRDIINQFPDVDPNNPAIKEALEKLQKQNEKKDEGKK